MAFNFPDPAGQATDGTYTHPETTPHGTVTYGWFGRYWLAVARTDLGDLDDVTITDASAQDVLVYNGTIWQNEPDVDGGNF